MSGEVTEACHSGDEQLANQVGKGVDLEGEGF